MKKHILLFVFVVLLFAPIYNSYAQAQDGERSLEFFVGEDCELNLRISNGADRLLKNHNITIDKNAVLQGVLYYIKKDGYNGIYAGHIDLHGKNEKNRFVKITADKEVVVISFEECDGDKAEVYIVKGYFSKDKGVPTPK